MLSRKMIIKRRELQHQIPYPSLQKIFRSLAVQIDNWRLEVVCFCVSYVSCMNLETPTFLNCIKIENLPLQSSENVPIVGRWASFVQQKKLACFHKGLTKSSKSVVIFLSLFPLQPDFASPFLSAEAKLRLKTSYVLAAWLISYQGTEESAKERGVSNFRPLPSVQII